MSAQPVAPFDVAASTYDAYFTATALGRRVRGLAWGWLDGAFGPGDRVLELGCGTGVDAVHLASHGVMVVATDVSERMLDATRRRVMLADANDLVEVTLLDIRSIGTPGWADELGGSAFDGAFADFGALNGIRDRPRLLHGLSGAIRPGGTLVAVVMGPACPWEIGWHVVHREPRAATRRWHHGRRARVGGAASMPVWYPSAGRFIAEADPWFALVREGGLGVALPPTGLALAVERRGWLLDALMPLERRLASSALAARIADHWVVELRRRHG